MKKELQEKHLTVKQLKEALNNIPDDFVVCMSADVGLGYVVGGQYYKVDQLSKALFIIDVTSKPEKDDLKF